MRIFPLAVAIVVITAVAAFANPPIPKAATVSTTAELTIPQAENALPARVEIPSNADTAAATAHQATTDPNVDKAQVKDDPPAKVGAPCPPTKTRLRVRHPKNSDRPSRAAATETGSTPPNAEAAIQTPAKSASMESKTIYAYMSDAVYRLYGAPLHIVDVQLQPGEIINGKVAAGDTVRWEIGVVTSGQGATAVRHVLIKPTVPGLETNFIIATDKHSYHLAAKSDSKFYIPTIGWTYPQEEMDKLTSAKIEEKRLEEQTASPAMQAESLNFNYRIKPKSDYPWTPLRVFDDGHKTYLQMNPKMRDYQAPVLFIKGDEGLNIVNYRVHGDFFIVDRLFEEAQLRSGKKDMVAIEKEGGKKKGFWPWSN